MQNSYLLNTQFFKIIFKNYFFIIILITPFLEFIDKNIIEFDSYITFQFLLFSALFLILQFFFILFLRNFFQHNNIIEYKECFSIAIYLQFKFQITRIFLSNLGFKLDGELALFLIIFLTIILIKLYKKIFFKNFIKVFFSLNLLVLLFMILANSIGVRDAGELKIKQDYNLFDNTQFEKIKVKRNIYYVIADAMTTLENFEDQYNVTNKEFRNLINANNMYYFKNTRSAYNNTIFNFTSFLNLNYLVDENDQIFTNRNKLYPSVMRSNLLANYPLTQTLERIGYKLKWEGSSRGNCIQYNTALCLNYDKKDNVEKVLEKIKLNSYIIHSYFLATAIIPIISRSNLEKLFFNKIESQFENNNSINNFISKIKNYKMNKKPHFFLIHHMAPHAPYIYDENCNRRLHKTTQEIYPIGYKLSYKCVLKTIEKLIDYVNENDPDAIVIIQGDHGNSFGRSQKEKQINTTKSFNLLKLNEKCLNQNFGNKLDMVNGVRLALSCATDQEVNFLDKKTYAGYPKKNKNYGKVYLIQDISTLRFINL